MPANPFVLQDTKNHFYGTKVPKEVNIIVEKENAALAKEIDDQKNSKIVTEVKSVYNQRYSEMKSEFYTVDKKNDHALKCYGSYLWQRNELETLKKIVLAEAYSDVIADKGKEGGHPSDIGALEPTSSLYKAILEGIRGGQDFPQRGLALNPQERASLSEDVKNYAVMLPY